MNRLPFSPSHTHTPKQTHTHKTNTHVWNVKTVSDEGSRIIQSAALSEHAKHFGHWTEYILHYKQFVPATWQLFHQIVCCSFTTRIINMNLNLIILRIFLLPSSFALSLLSCEMLVCLLAFSPFISGIWTLFHKRQPIQFKQCCCCCCYCRRTIVSWI